MIVAMHHFLLQCKQEMPRSRFATPLSAAFHGLKRQVDFRRATRRVTSANLMVTKPFWEVKPLAAMTVGEWESLCDGCGLCCLVRLEDLDSGEVTPTRIACRLFDAEQCRCTDYEHRSQRVPDCIKLTPHNIEALSWMPPSCAYRRLHEGKSLAALASPHHRRSRERPRSRRLGRWPDRQRGVPGLIPEQAADFLAPELMRDRGDDDFETSPARRLGAQTTILRRRSVGLP